MWRLSFIIIFSLILMAPAVQTALRFFPEAPVSENRILAPAPADFHNLHKTLAQSNAWFNDHFGFRSSLIRLKTQVDYSIFHTSDRVHIGQDGWLFYRSVMDVEKPAVERYLKDHDADVLAGLEQFTSALRRNGIMPIVLVNKLADRFYADKLPRYSIARVESPHIDQLEQHIENISSLSFVNATGMLEALKSNRPVFHKTDFHWNDPAAFPVAKEIVERASSHERRPSPWKHGLEISHEYASGGIASFMPLLLPLGERSLMVKRNWEFPSNFKQEGKKEIFEFATHVPTSSSTLKPIVLLGDSFSDALVRSGMYIYFQDFYRVRWSDVPSLSTFARSLPPGTGTVVIQFIEVQMQALKAFADKGDVEAAVKYLDAQHKAQP